MKKLLLFLSILISSTISGQEIQVASDINQGNDGSSINELFEFKDKIFFSAEIDDKFTRKLWTTDGTEANTFQIDNLPDKDYYKTNNHLYYADNSKIYKSDGTKANTIVVAENFVEIKAVATYNNFMYYIADITQNYDNRDMGLYKTDGNTTTLLKTFLGDQRLRVEGSPIDIISKFDDTRFIVYLKTKDLGNEPYISDGTEAGTYLLKDIVSGNGSSGPTAHTNLPNGNIFNFGSQLWFTDGTESGTIKLKSSRAFYITAFNNKGYFSTSAEFWETDGTIAGTKMIFNNKDGNGGIETIVNRGNDLLLFLERGIHVFNGTSANTTKIATPDITDIRPYFASTTTKTYFVANYKDEGYRLWSTNGTAAGTLSITPFWPNGQAPTFSMQILGENLIFSSGSNGGNYDTGELWVSDGTDSGTKLLKDINKSGNLGSKPKFQTELNGKIYFSADDNIHGRELFVFDGTSTSLVKDIFPGFNSSNPFDFYVLNDKIIFKAYTLEKGLELWITDGTEAGTKILKDINLNGNGFLIDKQESVRIQNFYKLNNELYFYADNGIHGMELWKTDGTETGTFMIKDINDGANASYRPALSSRPKFIEHNNELYFSVSDRGSSNNLSRFEIWKTDGTTDGTESIATKNNNIKETGIFFSFNNQFYFYGQDIITTKYDMYRTDFTTTTKIEGIDGFRSYYPLNDKIYFNSSSANEGNEIWSLDKNDTVALDTDIVAGPKGSTPSNFYIFKNFLYFNISNENFQVELYRLSDTSAPEKILTKESETNTNSLVDYFNYIPKGDKLFIYTKHNGNSEFRYKMYETNNSTPLVSAFSLSDFNVPYENLAGGLGALSAFINNKFYFTGNDIDKGEELLVVDLSAVLSVDDFNNFSSDESLGFTIYPNPVNNLLNIKSNLALKSGIIYNLLGKKISTVTSNSIDVSKFNSGIYILKIEDEFGNISSKKWIKK